MIITRLRSSAINTKKLCPHKHFLEYGLGLESKAGAAAEVGNLVHKILEGFALCKLAMQNGEKTFEISEFKTLPVDYPPKAIIEDVVAETPYSLKEIRGLVEAAQAIDNGAFNPFERNIVAVEKKFDLEIDEDWAKINYRMPDGQEHEINLGLHGTMDLIATCGDDLEIIDWKTGKWRTNFPEKTIKGYKEFMNDDQLLLYYYAARKLFPDKRIFTSIVWCRESIAFTLPFDDKDFEKAKNRLKGHFIDIITRNKPKLNTGWWCRSLCRFSKDKHPKSGMSICDHYRKEATIANYDSFIDVKSLGKYGAGGGKSA